jgi:colicin import membrane protein
MTSAVLRRDVLMPRPPDGMGPGLVLALLIHALLIAALALGVSWHASEPEGVAAELWAAVPQVAMPKAVEPEPQPQPVKPEPPVPKPEPKAEPQPDAQIAIEKAKREEQERKKKEEAQKLAEKQKQEQDDKRKKQLEEQKLAEFHAKEMKRILGQAGAPDTATAPGNSNRTAGPSASYAGRIKARIKPNIKFPDIVEGNPLATVRVKLAPDGTIVGRDLVKSSGVPAWDAAVLRAIDLTEVLPRDVDGRVWPSFEIDFRPRD